MAPYAESVLATDIDWRVLYFARANTAWNGMANIDFGISDVYESVEGTIRHDCFVSASISLGPA
jgi:methylase of polypeptide subunit release factors